MKLIKSFPILLTLLSGALFANADLEDLKDHVFTILPSLEGWCTEEKAMNFIDLVAETDPKVCVEIGVFGGSSAFPVISTLKYLDHEGLFIGIDSWDRLECLKDLDPIEKAEHIKWWSKLNLDKLHLNYLNMLKRYELEGNALTMKTTSEKAAQFIQEIDILHIDGSHTNHGSLSDVENYLPKVRSGGYIWMNDCLWEERQDALSLLLKHCTVEKLIDNGNCILFKKV